MARVPIKVNTAKVLILLGRFYQSLPDAIKEYVSNAVDAFLTHRRKGTVKVRIELHHKSIFIFYDSPGMTDREFREALQSVADSIKVKAREDIGQIGRLGVGLWNFLQYARRAEFLSRGTENGITWKVVLREGEEEADFSRATSKESLDEPSMAIRITELTIDPTTKKSPLSRDKIANHLARKFDAYLRAGKLEITIISEGVEEVVGPMEISLPRVARDYSALYAGGDRARKIVLTLWFEPSGNGRVAIRHMGIPIVDDLRTIQAYGLEESVFARGHLLGYIDADFLEPLPSRTLFKDGPEWIAFLRELDRIRPMIEAELELLRESLSDAQRRKVYDRALKLVSEIFSGDEFKGLELLPGLHRREVGPPKREETKPRKPRVKKPEEVKPTTGVSLKEDAFEDGPAMRCEFQSASGVIRVNTLHPDYVREMRGSETQQTGYIALCIALETISWNDKAGTSKAFLDQLLGFFLRMREKT